MERKYARWKILFLHFRTLTTILEYIILLILANIAIFVEMLLSIFDVFANTNEFFISLPAASIYRYSSMDADLGCFLADFQ